MNFFYSEYSGARQYGIVRMWFCEDAHKYKLTIYYNLLIGTYSIIYLFILSTYLCMYVFDGKYDPSIIISKYNINICDTWNRINYDFPKFYTKMQLL